jgi:AraC-like DNA-binding protein
MTATNIKVREHYSAVGLTDRIKAALATVTPESEALTVAQLAPLDQFHTRGILATSELAAAARIDSSTHVLDIGCGIGGPARYLAATFGWVLQPAWIEMGWRRSVCPAPKRRACQGDVAWAEARVLDVAVACGFKTQQHFARVFRRACGVSPTEYRQEFLYDAQRLDLP